MQPGDAEGGIGFIESAVGGNAQIVFLAPLAGAERRGAVLLDRYKGAELAKLLIGFSRSPAMSRYPLRTDSLKRYHAAS